MKTEWVFFRLKRKNKDEDLVSLIQPEDLLKFGLIPELIGRLPVAAPLHQLTKEAMRNILTEPKNAIIKQYKKLFLMEGVELEFDPFSLDAIVEKAMERKPVHAHYVLLSKTLCLI